MTSIAITGAGGLLGSTLMRTLLGAKTIQSDIRDADSLKDEITQSGAKWIVHTAAKTNVAQCEKDPKEAFAVNGEGTKHVVDAAHAIGARVIYISTVSVFSGLSGDYRESDMPEPINVHNASKVKGEEYVRSYDGGVILRLNLIGVHPEGSRGTNFIEWLIDSIKAGKDLSLFEDVMINPLSNWTVAKMISHIITTGTSEKILHIASSDVRSKADIGEMLAKRFPDYRGKINHVSVDAIADGVKRPKEMWLNTDYTKEKLGLTMPTLDAEIKAIFRHMI